MSLPTHSEYHETGEKWIGRLPSHWRLLPNKAMLQKCKREVGDEWKRTQLLSLTLRGVVPRDIESGEGKYPADFGTYQVVEPNDLVFCLFDMDETPRTVGLCPTRGMITGAYTVFQCKPPTHPAYVCYYYLHLDSYKGLRPFYSGLRKTVRPPTFLSIKMPAPPPEEQEAIISFLDRETSKIDALVAEQRRLIALLKEKRQAVITHAVTKGLNPDVPMKPSGIPWLGDVPEHWEVTRFGWSCDYISYGFTNPMPTTDEGPYLLTANDIDYGNVKYDTARRTEEDAFENRLTDKCRPLKNDLLLTKDGTLGRVAIHDGRQACINQSVALLRVTKEKMAPQFACLALQGGLYQRRMIYEAGGTTIKHIYISRLAKMPMAFPTRDEQGGIVEYLDERLRDIDALLAEAEKAIELHKERRTALISAAVTGKIDVRQHALQESA